MADVTVIAIDEMDVRRAIEAGVRVVCSTDAHSIRGLGNMPLSVHTARSGRATAADVLNTRSWIDLRGGGEAPKRGGRGPRVSPRRTRRLAQSQRSPA
jgi:hypothetical protein